MPKLRPESHQARLGNILEAAERCFISKGFHAATMDDICREAHVSPGALYTYFASKEDLIVGLCEREKERIGKDIAQLSEAADFLAALQSMAEHYCCNEPIGKVRLHIEIGAEAGRNEVIGETVRGMDRLFRENFLRLLSREKDRGHIAPVFPLETIIRAMGALGDGLFLQRSIDPAFDPKPAIPAMMTMISALLAPVPASGIRN